MRRFLLLAAVTAVAVAKPEMYREKEDFQYSRSSSDDGTKAGFYGAQRGNMGGNYERAHNMDTLAQHQMSGLVRQVDGELGDGAKTRTGSVFSAANSRGIYGSGNYDLSNLEGRNFQEGASYGESQSQATSSSHQSGYNAHSSSDSRAAFSSSQAQNAKYHSGYNTYESGAYSGKDLQSSNLYTADNLQATRSQDYGSRDSSGYYLNNGYHGSNVQSSSNLHNADGYGSDSQTRILSSRPVRVVVRPGTRVTIPIATQTYASNRRDSTFERNAVGSEGEILNNQNIQTNVQPTGNAKHYESSYSYRKEWEKHDTIPVIVPTHSQYPKNSELYEDNQASTSDHSYDASRINTANIPSSNAYSGYENHARSASSTQSHHQSGYNSAQHESSSSGSNMNAYGLQKQTGGTAAALNMNNQVEDFSSKPKSYQASYSYHKSWERQGDPYVIKPATNDISQTSQRLTSDSQYDSQNYVSHHRGSNTKSHNHYFNSNNADCDENGHIRVSRSYNTAQQNDFSSDAQEAQNLEDLGQQSQIQWDDLNLSQQTQQQWDQLEDGQQPQNKWDNLETLGQQTQNKWDKLETLGQETQNKWDNLEELGQQTLNTGNQVNAIQQEQKQSENLEDLGQQSQNQLNLQTAGQETQGAWDNSEQSQQNILDLGQQTQDTGTTLEQEPRTSNGETTNETLINSSKFNNVNTFTYPSDNKFRTPEINSDSQTQDSMNTLKEISQESRSRDNISTWDKEDTHSEHPYTYNVPQQTYNHQHGNQSSSTFNSDSYNFQQHHQQTYHESHTIHSNSWSYWNSNTSSITQDQSNDTIYNSGARTPSYLAGLWSKIDEIEKQSSTSINKDFTNNSTENTSLNKEILLDNVSNSNNNSRDNSYNRTIEYKSIPSYMPNTNKFIDDSTFTPKLQQSDVGRGDIGPEDSNSSENNPTTGSNTHNIVNDQKLNSDLTEPVIVSDNNSETNAENETHNSQNLFYLQNNNKSESNLDISSFNHNKWFENENQHSNYFLEANSSSTTTKPFNSTVLSIQDIPTQSVIVEQQNKKEQEINKYDNKFDTEKERTTENDKQSFESETTHQPKEQNNNLNQQNIHLQEPFEQQSTNNLEQSPQQSDSLGQQNVSLQESLDQQSTGNLEHFPQQSDSFDQQNVSPQESFDQQSMGDLEHFPQQSDSFDQQDVIPQESFDQQSMGNLEQFPQQSDSFDQQNVSPQESFDQQSMGNLEQFPQQSDSSDQQNVSPQESFDQQSMGNLEQFPQQSDSFDQQNVSPQESFDHQSMGNLEPFAEQNNDDLIIPIGEENKLGKHDDNSQANFGPGEEPFEQGTDHLVVLLQDKPENTQQDPNTQQTYDPEQQVQSMGDPKEDIQQQNISNNFEKDPIQNQQNVSSQESFDQQSMGNLEHFPQQSDSFDQQNVSPQESFDQQSMGNLEQFPQQSDSFDQQNVIPQESFDQQSMGHLEQFPQQSDSFDQQNVSPQESFHQQSMGNLETFAEQNNDDLIIPIDEENKLGKHAENSDTNFGPGVEPFEQGTDHLVIPLQVKPANTQQIPDTQQTDDQEQQVQSMWDPKEDMQQQHISNNYEKDSIQKHNMYNLQSQNNNQEKQGRENIKEMESIKKNETMDAPPEPVTEKPGFWKSIGNKFANAKDRVASWFNHG